jgi:hypothetical protein
MRPLVEPPQISKADSQSKLDDSKFTALAAESLMSLPAWIAPVTERVQQLHPLSGSRFEDDDQLKPTNPPSEQVINLLRSGLDHLHAVADAVGEDGKGPRPLAPYTLIRASIEASSLAAWLMMPGTKDARLKKSIRLSIANRRSTEVYSKKYDLGDKVSKWFKSEMSATRDQRPGTKNMNLDANFPKSTDLILETDKYLNFSGLAGIDAWRACSGIAHSNGQFAGAAVTRTATDASVVVTIKATTLYMMLEPAKQYFEFSLRMAEEHMAPNRSKIGP